jgi:hypothetical protein
MCGWIGNGIPARSPRRAINVWKLLGVIGPPRSVRARWLFATKAAQSTELVTLDNARRPAFVAADMQAPGIELDLVPLQIADLRRTQSVTVGD